MTKKKTLGICALIMAVSLGAVFTSYVQAKNQQGSSKLELSADTNDVVKGSDSDDSYYLDIDQTGIYYLDHGFMKYLDYETGKSNYQCDQSMCAHNDSYCGAFAVNFSGVGAYKGKMYALRKDYVNNSYDLLQMEMNGTERKVLTTFSFDENIKQELEQKFGNETASETEVVKNEETAEVEDKYDLICEDVYYAYGKAYLKVNYERGEEMIDVNETSEPVITEMKDVICQIVSVDLNTGESAILAQAEGTELATELDLSLISEDNILITKMETPDTMSDSYYEVLKVDSETGVQDVLLQGTCEKCDTGTEVINHIPYHTFGWYEGDLILYSDEMQAQNGHLMERNITVWRWNLNEKEPQKLFNEPNGYFLLDCDQPDGSGIHDTDKLIYANALSDTYGSDIQMKVWDLATGENEVLYEDVYTATCRLLSEIGDTYIAEIYDEDAGRLGVYSISKTDFYAGNLDAARMLIDHSGDLEN